MEQLPELPQSYEAPEAPKSARNADELWDGIMSESGFNSTADGEEALFGEVSESTRNRESRKSDYEPEEAPQRPELKIKSMQEGFSLLGSEQEINEQGQLIEQRIRDVEDAYANNLISHQEYQQHSDFIKHAVLTLRESQIALRDHQENLGSYYKGIEAQLAKEIPEHFGNEKRTARTMNQITSTLDNMGIPLEHVANLVQSSPHAKAIFKLLAQASAVPKVQPTQRQAEGQRNKVSQLRPSNGGLTSQNNKIDQIAKLLS